MSQLWHATAIAQSWASTILIIPGLHDSLRLVHEEQVAFNRTPREQTLEDAPVAVHLDLVLVGQVADVAGLEVD